MKSLKNIIQVLQQQKKQIRERYQITELGVFGSYARGEQTDQSDVDLLVDYEQAPTLFKLVELRTNLSQILEMEVDIVTKQGLKPRIRDRILAEVIYL